MPLPFRGVLTGSEYPAEDPLSTLRLQWIPVWLSAVHWGVAPCRWFPTFLMDLFHKTSEIVSKRRHPLVAQYSVTPQMTCHKNHESAINFILYALGGMDSAGLR